jgi:hypothetical protein
VGEGLLRVLVELVLNHRECTLSMSSSNAVVECRLTQPPQPQPAPKVSPKNLLPSRRKIYEYMQAHPEVVEDLLKCKRSVARRVAGELGVSPGTICWAVNEFKRYGLI